MSTLRYSGDVRIRVTYVDARRDDVYSNGTPRNPNGSYRCFLRAGNDTATIVVGAPAFLSEAVDSPEAFDDAARAAIAFADDEVSGWAEKAAFSEQGLVVARAPNAPESAHR